MKNPLIQKSILTILNRLDRVALRETTLASEVEIAIDRPLTTAEFTDELLFLAQRDLIARDRDSFDETLWSITQKGELALRGL
ncbi:MAG: hypothetical protein IJ146_10795 [Kiritimatiellae bacterium]|nr:hypothetical protein [Kiritimatiellia bacterium]